MKTTIVKVKDFKRAIMQPDNCIPFVEGEEATARQWEGLGGDPAAMLSLLLGPQRENRAEACAVLA